LTIGFSRPRDRLNDSALSDGADGSLRGRSSTVALAGYALLSVLLFGARVVTHPARNYVGGLTTDPQVFIWSLAWWPHAILNGQNPFVTKEIWAPVGVNLAWAQNRAASPRPPTGCQRRIDLPARSGTIRFTTVSCKRVPVERRHASAKP
jgi:hypothetical protein